MAKRQFHIYIYEDIDWEIRLKGLEDYDQVPAYTKGTPDYGFGIYKITPDGKIAYIFDIDVRDEDLRAAKDDVMMSEICEFVFENDAFEPVKETKFEGSFYDALVKTKEIFKGKK